MNSELLRAFAVGELVVKKHRKTSAIDVDCAQFCAQWLLGCVEFENGKDRGNPHFY